MNADALWESSKVFAPDFPRRSSSDKTIQGRRYNRGEFVAALEAAAEAEQPGYYSVYSFPRGHPQKRHLPKIDSVFIDLDIEGRYYQPNPDTRGYDTSIESWRASMSALLARARMIADAIVDIGQAHHFRVVLSGHKGIHLYLDFPEVAPENGEFEQFKNGLKLYGENVMNWLDTIAGGVNIDPWVDVDASDLARLARHPNTPHHGAAYDDVLRWAVPVTVEELTTLTVDDYLSLTSRPRPLPENYERVPSESAHDKLVQAVRSASASGTTSHSNRRRKTDEQALSEYRDEQNTDITLDDALFLVKNKPCIARFRERDDAYEYGESSRAMELSIMGRLLDMKTPLDVIHEFFAPIPGYDEKFTDSLLADLIARNNTYGEFDCTTIAGGWDGEGQRKPAQAREFCLGEQCQIYRRADDIDKL